MQSMRKHLQVLLVKLSKQQEHSRPDTYLLKEGTGWIAVQTRD
jgi:hypothetical protein